MGRPVKGNVFLLRGEIAVIPLTSKGVDLECLIDADSIDIINGTTWYAQWNRDTKSYYAVGRGRGTDKTLRMHRIICKPTKERRFVDHKNHNTLDNRRENLTAATRSENGMNRRGVQDNSKSGYRGAH